MGDQISNMSGAEIAALDMGALSEADAKAVDARLAELAEERAAGREAAEKRKARALEAKRAAFEEETLPALVEKHGALGDGLAIVEHHSGFMVVKRPHPAPFKKLCDQQKLTADAAHAFVLPCVVHPEKAKAEDLFDKYPGLIVACAGAAADLARAHKAASLGK